MIEERKEILAEIDKLEKGEILGIFALWPQTITKVRQAEIIRASHGHLVKDEGLTLIVKFPGRSAYMRFVMKVGDIVDCGEDYTCRFYTRRT